jgi:peptidoglycan/xylan/chitin deacetylase (PgdA/CDA1 family)
MGVTGYRVTRRQLLGVGIGAAASALLAACGSARPGAGTLTVDQGAASLGKGPAGGSSTSMPPSTEVSTTTMLPDSGVSGPVDPSAVAAANGGRRPLQWGVDVTGVHTQLADGGSLAAPTLALTFDACGGPGGSGVDRDLLEVLSAAGVPATLFLNLRWIEANRPVAERLGSDPLFELANHGSRHLPLSVQGQSAYGIVGTGSASEAADEVWANHEVLTALTGSPPRWFRSGTAHYDEVAADIAVQLGEQPVGFTTNGDFGATASSAQVTTQVVSAPPGGIVIAHMNQPGSGTARGVAAALARLQATGTRFVTVSGGGGTTA